MNAARRADPPAAIYYRARCLVQFTYDYADAPGSAPTYASTRQDETGKGRAASDGRIRGWAPSVAVASVGSSFDRDLSLCSVNGPERKSPLRISVIKIFI